MEIMDGHPGGLTCGGRKAKSDIWMKKMGELKPLQWVKVSRKEWEGWGYRFGPCGNGCATALHGYASRNHFNVVTRISKDHNFMHAQRVA